MDFAHNLKKLMDENGVSNYQLAKGIGCHQSNISYWVSGDRLPQPRMRKAVADYFGVSVSWLMGENPVADILQDLSIKTASDAMYEDHANKDVGHQIDRVITKEEKGQAERTMKVMRDNKKSPAPEGAELSEARMKLLAAIDGMSEEEVLAMVQMAEAAKRMRGEGK